MTKRINCADAQAPSLAHGAHTENQAATSVSHNRTHRVVLQEKSVGTKAAIPYRRETLYITL